MNIEHILANLQSAGVFIVFLSILILVHEWGHFIVAKRVGVKVEEFALGFGPTLFSKVYHGTNYMIKLLPLGGFVRMAGDERQRCKGDPGEFLSKSVGHRALIVLNGPMINFVLAYACFVLVFMMGYPDFSTEVVGLRYGSPAQVAGIKTGDKILRIDNQEVRNWTDVNSRIIESRYTQINVDFKREGKEYSLNIIPQRERQKNVFGQYENKNDIGLDTYSNKIGYLQDDYPAQMAGLKIGDRIIKINGKDIYGWNDLQENISNASSDQIFLQILREGQIIAKTIMAKVEMRKNEFGQQEYVRFIGVGLFDEEMEFFDYGFGTSIVKGAQKFVEITIMTYKAVYFMATGKMSAKENVAGPVGIFTIVDEFSKKGLSHFLLILGVISANLAIFNLFPVIPLDGGHLFLQGIEKIRGRALPEKVDEAFARVGLSLIILLALFVFYVDFERIGLIEKIRQLFS